MKELRNEKGYRIIDKELELYSCSIYKMDPQDIDTFIRCPFVWKPLESTPIFYDKAGGFIINEAFEDSKRISKIALKALKADTWTRNNQLFGKAKTDLERSVILFIDKFTAEREARKIQQIIDYQPVFPMTAQEALIKKGLSKIYGGGDRFISAIYRLGYLEGIRAERLRRKRAADNASKQE